MLAMVSITNAMARSRCDAVVDACDVGGAGSLVVYDGVAPANVEAALSGNTTLATLTLSDPAFGAAAPSTAGSDATAAGNAVTGDSSADASGTATFARILNGSGTPVLQLTVSVTGAGGEVTFDTLSFNAGDQVNVTSMSYTERVNG